MYAEWWYLKQHNLHWMYVNKPEWASFFALIPKPDSSHGFPWKYTPSRYAQFADDNFNSEGYVGWYTYGWVTAATIWAAYVYFWPRRWMTSFDFLDDENINRIHYADAMSSAGYDMTWLYMWNNWQRVYTPHKYHWWRVHRMYHFSPDSKINPVIITLNRRNTCYDHHWSGYGNYESMH
jgi:hypothetical protein